MFAVLLHVMVVQPHIHAAPPALTGALHEDAATALPAHPAETHVANAVHQPACAVCGVLATAGQMAAPKAGAATITLSFVQEPALFAIGLAPFALTHSWRSRAPPAAL
jgi:hypothetical protein